MTGRLLVTVSVIAASLAGPGVAALPGCTDRLEGLSERCPRWVASYSHTGMGGRGPDVGRDVALSPDGSTVFITGQSFDDATREDQALVALDSATGARRWVARYDGSGLFDTGSALAVAPDGSSVFVSGRSTLNGSDFDWVTVAYDAATGAQRWASRLETPASDRTWGIAASPDGDEVYVVGEIAGKDIAAVAYDAATGEERWRTVYDNGGYDWALEIAIAPDGSTVYAGGTSGSGATGVDVVAVAFRTRDENEEPAGSVRWVARIDGGRRGDETFAGLVARDGEVAVAGWTKDAAGADRALTVLVDAADGSEIWRADTGASVGVDERQAVAFAGDKVMRIARTSLPFPDQTEMLTIAYEADDGSLAWSAIQGSGPYMLDFTKAVAASPGGSRVYVTGYGQRPRGETGSMKLEPGVMTTVVYDAATGARRWVAQHDQSGIGADFASAVMPSPDGSRVYVGGTFITSGLYVWAADVTMAYAYDYGVIAYDA